MNQSVFKHRYMEVNAHVYRKSCMMYVCTCLSVVCFSAFDRSNLKTRSLMCVIVLDDLEYVVASI